MKKNVVQAYADKYAGSVNIKETEDLGTQCVALAKHFTKEVIWVSLWAFWGSAKNGWVNTSNTFSSDWEKIENNPNDPAQVPKPWDIIFWTTGKFSKYGHVGVVLKTYKRENRFIAINQNSGSGDWKGQDDAVRIQEYSYKDVAGWYHYKKFIAEFEGLPVVIKKEQPKDSATRRGTYIPKSHNWPYIILYPNFWNASLTQQYAILEHEYSHYIYFDVVPQQIRTKWEEMSNLPLTAQAKFLLRGKVYKNIYLNDHAKKSPSEDFSECWEDTFVNPGKRYWSYLDVKIDTVVAVMKKYDSRSA